MDKAKMYGVGAKEIFYYGLLFDKIYKLGLETEINGKRFFNKCYIALVISTITFMSFGFFAATLKYLFVVPENLVCTISCWITALSILCYISLAAMIISAAIFVIHAVKIHKNIKINDAIDRRLAHIELILFAFFNSPSTFNPKKLPSEDIGVMKAKTFEFKQTTYISIIDVDYLINKMSEELKQLEKKRRNTGIVLFLATIIALIIEVVKNGFGFLLWNDFPLESTDATKALITLLASSFALFIFVIIVLISDLVKSPIYDLAHGSLIRNDAQLRNIEYAIFILNAIKEYVKTEQSNVYQGSIVEEGNAAISSVELSCSANEKNEFEKLWKEQNGIVKEISESLSGIKHEFKTLNENQRKMKKVRITNNRPYNW